MKKIFLIALVAGAVCGCRDQKNAASIAALDKRVAALNKHMAALENRVATLETVQSAVVAQPAPVTTVTNRLDQEQIDALKMWTIDQLAYLEREEWTNHFDLRTNLEQEMFRIANTIVRDK